MTERLPIEARAARGNGGEPELDEGAGWRAVTKGFRYIVGRLNALESEIVALKKSHVEMERRRVKRLRTYRDLEGNITGEIIEE